MRPLPRVVTLAVVGAALVGGLVVDRDRATAEDPAAFGRGVARAMAVVPAVDAVSTAWYCPGVPAPADATASGDVVVVNVGTTTAQVVLRSVPSEADGVDVAAPDPLRFDLLAGARRDVRLAELAPAPFAAAVVEVSGGQVVVEQTALLFEGRDTTPCAREASDTWYLADGVTTDGATLTYVVFNPFPDAAVLDVTLATDLGPAEPQDVQGLVVPGGALRLISVGDQVRDRSRVAAELVARTGRVVVGRLQQLTAVTGRPGVASALGAPELATDHLFTAVEKADGVATRLVVHNPGQAEAVVLVELRPAAGIDPAVGEPEPLQLTVPARSVEALDLSAEELVAPGRYVATVRSSNGVPVAVERAVDRTAAAGTFGHAVTVGATLSSARWAIAAGGTLPPAIERLDVTNTTADPVTFTVTALDGNPLDPALVDVAVGPLATTTVDLGAVVLAEQLGVLVEATGAVVVERTLLGGPVSQTSQAPGVPFEPVGDV